jgi:type VI secretion system protein
MAIKLRVISDQYRELGEHRARVFGVNGGTIGRAPDNDWVLPDPKRVVSGHHCEVEYRSGAFWLKDTSTNGVFVNESQASVAETGPVELRDGDRVRLGDYEILVSVDDRIDFLPAAAELSSAAQHLDAGIGVSLDLDSLLTPRDPADSGSVSVRNVFGIKVPAELREGAYADVVVASEAPSRRVEQAGPPVVPPTASASPPEWAMKTRAITRQELADALARRQSRIDARQQTLPFHQQATTWADLRSAAQAFCRGAGLEPSRLSAEALSMLPLVAGQLLREAVVGLNDLHQARAGALPQGTGSAAPQALASNPLRNYASLEQALVRLFESQGRVQGGPVDALREMLLEARDHEAALNAGMRAGLAAVLDQLAPTNVADQFEQGRARALSAGQDPRSRYWEHYADLFRVLSQNAVDGMPHPFLESFSRAYQETRDELSARRRGRSED